MGAPGPGRRGGGHGVVNPRDRLDKVASGDDPTEVEMFRQISFHSEEMALALFLWLCSLPLVAFIVMPLFGWPVAAIVALALFFVAMAICWGVCTWKNVKAPSSTDSLDERRC